MGVSDWLTRSRENGPENLRQWATGTAGNARYTYGTHYVVTGLMVLAIALYP